MNFLEEYINLRIQTLEFCSHLQAEDYSIQVVEIDNRY